MGTSKTARNTIFDLFQYLRNLIRKYYHKKWNESKLGSEPVMEESQELKLMRVKL